MSRQRKFLRLSEIQSGDAELVGQKAFNCARLLQAGFPAPDGIVITPQAGETSIDAPELRRWVEAAPAGTLFAVRSSGAEEDAAGHSFAGIYETRLNVSPADLDEAVRACRRSAASPIVSAYRRARNLTAESATIAVLIQCMIQAAASGVAFTTNPISGSSQEILVNSVEGLGEALVSGRSDPDAFTMRKSDYEIVSTHLAHAEPSLTNAQLRELAALLARIETHFGAPQDVEWCHDGSQFWIVQSRPITTNAKAKTDIEWTRANAREVLPDLGSPMTIYSVADVIEDAERRFYGKLLAPESELGRVAQVFYGRLYFNVDQMRHVCKMTGAPPAAILRSIGHTGEFDPADEFAPRPPLGELARVFPDLLRLVAAQLVIRKRVHRQIARTNAYVEYLNSLHPSDLGDREIWTEARRWRPSMVQDMQVVFALTSVSAYEDFLRRICRYAGFPYARLLQAHLAAGEKSVSAQQAFDLLRLVQTARAHGKDLASPAFESELERFLQKYGHRGPYESEIAIPRYSEDPSPLIDAVRTHLQSAESADPEEIIQRHEAEAIHAWREFLQALPGWKRFWLAPLARALLRRIKRFYVWRERMRSEMLRIGLPGRRLHLELARRFVERGWIPTPEDYFYLRLEEVESVIDGRDSGASLSGAVARRKQEWDRLAALDMPFLVKQSQLAAAVRHLGAADVIGAAPSQLRGLCISPGYVEGEVVVLRTPVDFSEMKRGAILVAPATDPAWTPLFTLASGVIVEIGGLLSHASTIAREYGLPAVANVKNATKLLKNGDRVRLDATNGAVSLI